MANGSFKKLLEMARSDLDFLHKLIFYPKGAIEGLDFLTDNEKKALLALTPEGVFRDILRGGGELEACTVTVNCTVTCTHTVSALEQLEQVRNPSAPMADCGVTVQCGSTCTYTASGALDRLGQVATLKERIAGQLGS